MLTVRFRFWLPAILFLFAFLLRSYNLNAPLLDAHSWRQADTSAIARNFIASGYWLTHPQVDWGGQTPGYVESEFPLYTAVLAFLYGLLGTREWLGRFLTAVVSAAAPVALYFLVRAQAEDNTHHRRVALYSALVLCILPFAVYFGRTVMPDSLMFLTAILAIWSFQRWLVRPTTASFFLALLLGALAPLAKTPNLVIIAVPLAYLTLALRPALRQWPLLLLYGLVFALPSLAWMRHARSLPVDPTLSFGIGEKLFDARLMTDPQFYVLLARWSVENVVTLAGLPFLLLGFVTYPTKARAKGLVHAWLLGVLLFLLIGAAGVVGQDYYILPLAGPAAWLIGSGLAWLQTAAGLRLGLRFGVGAVSVALVAVGALSAARILPLYQTADFYKTLGQRVDLALPEDERVGVIAPAVSEVLYYGVRKGWRLDPGVLIPGGLDSLGPDLGVRFVLITDPWLSQQRSFLTQELNRFRRVPVGPYALLLDLQQPGIQRPFELIWETGHVIEEPFLEAWRRGGGLDVFGFPLSDALEGQGGQEQYFERVVLAAGSDGVYPAPAGRLLLEAEGQEAQPTAVADEFVASWQGYGGEAVLGKAVSSVIEQQGRRVQYFENGFLEIDGRGEGRLGAVGRRLLELRGLSEERQIELARRDMEE